MNILDRQQFSAYCSLHNSSEHQASLRQEQLIVSINHEFRTPLTAVQGFLELLRDQKQQLDADTQAEYINHAIDACEQLHYLISSILALQEVDKIAKSLKLERLLVKEQVHEALKHIELQRMAHSFDVVLPDTLCVWADHQHLQRILRHLLSNACNYSPVHAPIIISATLPGNSNGWERSTPRVTICVKDFGSGIRPTELPLLFHKFMRLQRDLAGTVRGAGLGLYISRQMVEAMGGRVWIESPGIPGEGSCCYFTLPYVPAC